MGSDIKNLAPDVLEKAKFTGDLGAQVLSKAGDEGGIEGVGQVLDPLDIFGQAGEREVEEAGAEARTRIVNMLRSANRMRKQVLARINERELTASRAAAGRRIEDRRRAGRASTILTR
jgi:hypothetical protein